MATFPKYSYSWKVDETYVKVKGEWKYLYLTIDKHGDTIDFYLSHTRSTKAAKRCNYSGGTQDQCLPPVSLMC